VTQTMAITFLAFVCVLTKKRYRLCDTNDGYNLW